MCSSETKPHPTRPILIFVIADASRPPRMKTTFIANRLLRVGGAENPPPNRISARQSFGHGRLRASAKRIVIEPNKHKHASGAGNDGTGQNPLRGDRRRR